MAFSYLKPIVIGMLIIAGLLYVVVSYFSTVENLLGKERYAHVVVEGTIERLILDEREECRNTCSVLEYPIDEAFVRIENVVDVKNPTNLMISNELKNGNLLHVRLTFSGRPAKVLLSQRPETSPGSRSYYLKPRISKLVNGTLHFEAEKVGKLSDSEFYLAGLSRGKRIRAQIDLTPRGTSYLNHYEVIP